MAKDPVTNRKNQKAHYLRHPEYYRKKNGRARDRKAEYIRSLRESPCTDCGTTYPWYVMEFDHNRDKVFSIAQMTSASWTQLFEELEKCDLVCANCHRTRTHLRRNA